MRRRSGLLAGAALLLAAGCRPTLSLPDLPAWQPISEPPPSEVETVLFLVGDAGKAVSSESPILVRLQRDVEQWSRDLARDSAAVVVFLGDNVYPAGLRDAGTPEFPEDSARLQSQVDVLARTPAGPGRALGIFIAGNHDWGQKPGKAGLDRLTNMGRFIERRRAGGAPVVFLPEPGKAGPAIVDLGKSLRLLLLDTAWWLQADATQEEKDQVARDLDLALRTAGPREVVIAAHHPFKSASPHGGLVPFWETLGVEYLLARSGAMLQDLNSVRYKDLRSQLLAVFRRGRVPLLYAGGHDHSLQVMVATDPAEPRYMVVSGTGSKVSDVGYAAGMRLRKLEPGYMRLVVRKSGEVDLFVIAAPEDFLKCDQGDEDFQRQCREVGVTQFRIVYSAHLE